MPPPSPHTNPSRPASNGRDALCGSSLRVDMAFMDENPNVRRALEAEGKWPPKKFS